MKTKDIEFKKECQIYDENIKKLLKNGNISEANRLLHQMEETIKNWENEMRSIRFRLYILKNTYISLSNIKRTSRKK